MKHLKILIPLASSLALLASCSSVDLDPTDKYDVSFAMKNETNANLYIDYFYQVVSVWSPFGSCALGGANANMSDGLTDILKFGSIAAGAGDCNLIMTVDGQQSVNSNYFDSWTTGYSWIRRMNEALFYLDEYKANFNESQYARLKAEILFFRAHVMFYMMRSHASKADDLGIILYNSLAEMSVATKNTARSSVDQCWDSIADDLDFCISNLPEPGAAAGRVHRYAACALKARAMLYAERHSVALEAISTVEAAGIYEYLDDYPEVFSSLANSEVIWGFGYHSGDLTHNFDSRYSMPGDYCLSGSKGSGMAGPTQEFVDAFDNADGTPFDPSDLNRRYITNDNISGRDPRLAASVLYNGAIWKGRALECYEGAVDQKYMPYGSVNTPGNTVTGYYMKKLLDESNSDFVLNGSYQCWPEYRYAELMLIKAECLSREGKYTQARQIVADLRAKRFGKTVFTGNIDSWESALDVILHERMIELCYEDHRFWDLRRVGRARSVLDGKRYSGVLWHKAGDSFTPESVSADMGPRKYPERFDRFPIPQSEISNNNKAKQNKDW